MQDHAIVTVDTKITRGLTGEHGCLVACKCGHTFVRRASYAENAIHYALDAAQKHVKRGNRNDAIARHRGS